MTSPNLHNAFVKLYRKNTLAEKKVTQKYSKYVRITNEF